MSPKIVHALKSLLQKSGYSEEAQAEIWKWYKPTRKNRKALKKWHSRAMLIDFKKTTLTIVNNDPNDIVESVNAF